MKKMMILLIAVAAILPACATSQNTQAPELRFVPKITMYEAGVVHFELGISNESDQEFSGMSDINLRIVVTDADGKIRNQMQILDLGRIPAKEVVYPLSYDAEYDFGQYKASLSGEGIPSLSVPFEIGLNDGLKMLAAPSEFINPFTDFTTAATDL